MSVSRITNELDKIKTTDGSRILNQWGNPLDSKITENNMKWWTRYGGVARFLIIVGNNIMPIKIWVESLTSLVLQIILTLTLLYQHHYLMCLDIHYLSWLFVNPAYVSLARIYTLIKTPAYLLLVLLHVFTKCDSLPYSEILNNFFFLFENFDK